MYSPHRTVHAGAFIVLALLLLTLAVPAGAERIVAPTGAEFVSIQDAVDWSSAGETIRVHSGFYMENLRITKKVTLIGQDTGGGAPVISPNTKDPAVVVLADGCTIEGFTVLKNEQNTGIRITSGNNTIRHNTVRGNLQGIVLSSSSKNIIADNVVSENSRAGLVLEEAGENLITGNMFEKNPLGLSLDEYSLSNQIYRNDFLNTQNVVSKSPTSVWDSRVPYTYTYLGRNATSRMGNYWNDYRGRDATGDGIGDTPYMIRIGALKAAILESEQDSSDVYPLMDPVRYYTRVTAASGNASPLQTAVTPGTAVSPSATKIPGVSPLPAIPWSSWPVMAGGVVLVLLLAALGALSLYRHRGAGRVPDNEKPLDELNVVVPAVPEDEGAGDSSPHVVLRAATALRSAVEKTRSLVTIPSLKTVLPGTDPDNEPRPLATDQKNYFPRELENKYTDIMFIGRGGIAWVFSAIRKTDGKKVAVKIPISFDEVTGKCFLNEIAAWETLRHRNIVEVTAVNILPLPFVEMEFVPNSLEALDKPLPVWKAVHIITGVVDGLRYAHEHGFIHRDIKPHNILLTDDLVPKITDWGMSKVLAADVKKSSVAGFSLSYAAPEQVSPTEFGRTGEATDIYQLGVVFYELVTGSIPFGGESIVEVGNAILRDPPLPPSEYNPDAAAVEKIILRCLGKDPASRYQSAAELLDALHGYLDEDEE